MDLADAADIKIEIERAAAISHRKPEGPESIGECLWCQEQFQEGDKRRWCDAGCRDAWELSTRK